MTSPDIDRRKKVRRSATLLAVIALAFYFGFIAMSLVRASRSEHRAEAPHVSHPQG